MKCEIIRDLLPSYVDGLTSEESQSGDYGTRCGMCALQGNFGANAGGGAGEGTEGKTENQPVSEV